MEFSMSRGSKHKSQQLLDLEALSYNKRPSLRSELMEQYQIIKVEHVAKFK